MESVINYYDYTLPGCESCSHSPAAIHRIRQPVKRAAIREKGPVPYGAYTTGCYHSQHAGQEDSAGNH
ncbi:hypothetical protein [Chitinophaga nivalis]|uniref:Uncharacterized protein n=1 Tax=Chitinophaga nivalis TaxID=2991709 RepID=A0ABT3IKV1_9BACT|nr:hypothetical protein [Chitinophaga nivalis]MCW3465722.1 hypothetical protein [Chitinophaga nivalis]MCW3484587.1 hypothetical protein [Chitinophaga nivalis]